MNIRFLIDSWEGAEDNSPEIRSTVGNFGILVASQYLTRNEDVWAQSVRKTTRVSVYPIALWLAASWWRLRWEPLPSSPGRVDTSWRMAHEIAGAGFGYVWPRIVFASDGSYMNFWCVPSDPDSKQPVHYLSNAFGTIPAEEFVTSLDSFIDLVIERLESEGLSDTELSGLWSEVLQERSDPDAERYRRIEAMLGFDPDDLPDDIVKIFLGLGKSIGDSVLGEIATVCASADPVNQLDRITNIVDLSGAKGKFSEFEISYPSTDHVYDMPWLYGRHLAQATRDALHLNGSAVSDKLICDLTGLTETQAFEDEPVSASLPLGLAVREGESENYNFYLRRHFPTGRRFELSRLLCDHLLSSSAENWLSATDTKTIRQKWQRAFAAEFLCPIDALRERMEGDYSENAVEEASHHFGVSELAVKSQLVNHGLLPSYMLGESQRTDSFPYDVYGT